MGKVHLDNLPCEQIIDDHATRGAASVDEALARGVSWREMAPGGHGVNIRCDVSSGYLIRVWRMVCPV